MSPFYISKYTHTRARVRTHAHLLHFFYYQSLTVKKGKDNFELGLYQPERMPTRVSQTSSQISSLPLPSKY